MSSSVLGIMNIGHTCVIPGFFLAMAEWNVDGDG